MTGFKIPSRRVRLLIQGRVQGVFFRAYTKREAARLGLVGWVRNLPTGEVETVAEGEPKAIEQFIAWCRHGPLAAEVSNVEIFEERPTGSFSAFTIR